VTDIPREFQRLQLGRPLAVVFARATGPDPEADRLVEIGVLRLAPKAEPDLFHTVLNANPCPLTPPTPPGR
jgi:hypothetical protein